MDTRADVGRSCESGSAYPTAREGTARERGCEPACNAARTAIAPAAAGGCVPRSRAAPEQPPPRATEPAYVRPTYYPWADLLRWTFAIDVLECPECGGRLRLLATIAHPPTIAAILRHLGPPGEVPAPTPARQALTSALCGRGAPADALRRTCRRCWHRRLCAWDGRP